MLARETFPRSMLPFRAAHVLLLLVGLAIAASPFSSADALQYLEGTDRSIPGLKNTWALVVSPDGGHVYVAAAGDDTLSVFARNADTGDLRFVEAHTDGVDGVDGLNGAVAVTMSPDGVNVYVVGHLENTLAAFSREPNSGRLTALGVYRDGVGAVEGLAGPFSVAVSPDGTHVYATGEDDDAVVVFARDPRAGVLTFAGAIKDGVDGVDGLDGATSVTVSPDGAYVYVTGENDDALSVFRRDLSTGDLTFVEVHRDGVDGVDGLDWVGAVVASPDGGQIYVTGYCDQAIAAFSRDASTGMLRFLGAYVDGTDGVDGLRGVRAIAISADGRHLYAGAVRDDSVTVFERDLDTGSLRFSMLVKDEVAGVEGLDGAIGVAVSPQGAHVYAVGKEDDALTVFARDVETGALRSTSTHTSRLYDSRFDPWSMVVSPDGAHLYGVSPSRSALGVFVRDARTGRLTTLELVKDGDGSVDGLGGASALAMSPDGVHVYATGYWDNALAVFRRVSESGSLRFVEVHRDGVDGVDGLNRPRSITVSPDGAHVYAAGTKDNAVAVFARAVHTGTLIFVHTVRNGVDGVYGLEHARTVTVSPDGAHVYVTALEGDAIAAFARDARSGRLNFVDAVRDEVGGVEGLDGAMSVTVSPDGAHVYATAYLDNAVTVFRRDARSGALDFVEAHSNGVEGVEGLYWTDVVMVTGDGAEVYATGVFDGALAVFRRNPSTGSLTFVAAVRGGKPSGYTTVRGVTIDPNDTHVYVSGFGVGVAVFARTP